MQSNVEYVHSFKSCINVYYYKYKTFYINSTLVFEMLIYFDSGYLQPDTSYNKNSFKALVLILSCYKIGHYFTFLVP